MLVTGSTGYIGKALIKKLIEKNFTPVVLLRNYLPTNNEDDSLIKYDYNNLDIENLKKLNIKCIYHLAWGGAYGNDRNNITLQLENIKTDQKILEIAKQIGCKQIVYASSIGEFQFVKDNQIDFTAYNVYAATKLLSHVNFIETCNINKIQFKSVIITNTYGGDINFNRFIHNCIINMHNNIPMKLSSCVQDFDVIHIDDLSEFFILVSKKDVMYAEFYAGNNDIYPLKKYVEEIKNVVNPHYNLEYSEYKGEPLFSYKLFQNKNFQLDTYIPKHSFKKDIIEMLNIYRESKNEKI